MASAAQRYYPSTESSLDRRPKRQLNPIIEEESDDDRRPPSMMDPRFRRNAASQLKIQAWLSPMSDHFPTPRGVHYLAAPVVPASPSTASACSSPTSSSNQWNRASIGTMNTEFEDLYDASDDDRDVKRLSRANSQRKSTDSSARVPMRLVIPTKCSNVDSDSWSALEELKKKTSPVQLTPSARLTMSPAQMEFMDQQRQLASPNSSAPPSLDGSLNSDQLALMSAPPTPIIGPADDEGDEAWAGVHLQPGALETLQALSGSEVSFDHHQEQVLEVPEPVERTEMQQRSLGLITSFRPQAPFAPSPSANPHRQSLADLTRLDIPSPGGFFGGLSPRSRNTWHLPTKTPDESEPPTSTTAEEFYKTPWSLESVPTVPKRSDNFENFYKTVNSSASPVEQVIEVAKDVVDEDDMPTAKPLKTAQLISEASQPPATPGPEVVPNEIVVDYDPESARKQQEANLNQLDRTEMWLAAQRAYLKGIDGNDEQDTGLDTIPEALEDDEAAAVKTYDGPAPVSGKKSVRFSNVAPISKPKPLQSKYLRSESAFYRSFQDYVVRSHMGDAFVHQLPRFEALQAQRVSLKETHVNQLLGKHQLSVVPQSAKKRLSANVARDDHDLVDSPEQIRKEKEAEAFKQTNMSNWHVAATKYLNGGRLISAPVANRLARISRMAPGSDGVSSDRARILDLGGQATCDWGWHCALQYPNTKIYTVTTKAIRQLSNSNIRGPPNHRQVAVERLTRLPFDDDQFDLISARELHSLLKLDGENGEDEWETCLKECMRVLKPGGYLEFSLLDADIMNAGPLGQARSVEFGFSLKTLGYDPNPSKMWLGRLSRAGFQDVRRAWMCLPVGPKKHSRQGAMPPLRDSSLGSEVKTCQLEAMVMGSTEDVSSVCSIAAGWSWERWLLRCEMEKVSGELRLADTVTNGPAMEEASKCLDGVHAVMEEGSNCKAGFRMLNGYARKPIPGTGLIQIALG